MIRILSQNLCSWGSGENAILNRTERFRKLVNIYTPDVIGVQEATPVWREYLYTHMSEYDRIGLPRQEGPKGESCDIFWRRDMFVLLSGGTRWLSKTPHVISKLEDSSHYRVFTWAVLKRKADNRQFLVCNIHTDYITQKVCLAQLELMTEFARKLCLPTVLMGDMNMERDHLGYFHMTDRFEDTCVDADQKEFAEIKTSHEFGIKALDCDYIFINSRMHCRKHRVAIERIDGQFVSDHFGVYAELMFSEQ